MAQTFVSIDFYNENFSCRINNTSYVFSSKEQFVTRTGFPFEDTVKMISYEPERNINTIHYSNGTIINDSELPEIAWIQNNLAAIEQGAKDDAINSIPVISAADQRNILLYSTDYIVQRHSEETLLNLPHTLDDNKFNDILVYRQALRDLNVNGFVEGTTRNKTLNDVTWPVNPLA